MHLHSDINDTLTMVSNLTVNLSPNHFNSTISNYPTPNPLSLLSLFGVIPFLWSNKPEIKKKETLQYIHADSRTRFHEYLVTVKFGMKQTVWDKFLKIFPLEVIKLSQTMTHEMYYLPNDYSEQNIPENCTDKKKIDDSKSKVILFNLKKLKDLEIEKFYLVTISKEKSKFIQKIELDYYPDYGEPQLIEIRNTNKINIRHYVITLTKNQTKFLLNKNKEIAKNIKWHNDNVEDCYLDNENLKITLKEIPMSMGDLSGSVQLNLF